MILKDIYISILIREYVSIFVVSRLYNNQWSYDLRGTRPEDGILGVNEWSDHRYRGLTLPLVAG